jgi:RimJ/RimL family protein N-acetyltransferase
VYRSPAVRRFLNGPLRKSRSELWRDLRETSNSDFQMLTVKARSRHAFVGVAGFRRWDSEPASAEFYCYLRRFAWCRGLASEITAALVKAAFQNPKLQSVFGVIDPRNRASLKMVRRLGFQLRGPYLTDGWQRHHHVVSLSRRRHNCLLQRTARIRRRRGIVALRPRGR